MNERQFTSMAQKRRFEWLQNEQKKSTTERDAKKREQHVDNQGRENFSWTSGQHPSGTRQPTETKQDTPSTT